MKILLIGSGGREHALAWKMAQSPSVDRLIVAPGNAGTHTVALANGGRVDNVSIAADDVPGLVAFALSAEIDLVVVGPEVPLAKGLADELRDAGVATFGPSATAARLEIGRAHV